MLELHRLVPNSIFSIENYSKAVIYSDKQIFQTTYIFLKCHYIKDGIILAYSSMVYKINKKDQIQLQCPA